MLAQIVRNDLKKELDIKTKIELKDIEIVDNPNQVIVQFPIVSDIKLNEKLPFFKSILAKCANL